MEAVTPTVLTQKAAMSAAAVMAMPWCQMSGHVQVGFCTWKAPASYLAAKISTSMPEWQNYYLLFLFPLRYWWMWKQSRYLWWWAVYQYPRGISLPLLWWIYGFYRHENLCWWVAVCTRFSASLDYSAAFVSRCFFLLCPWNCVLKLCILFFKNKIHS